MLVKTPETLWTANPEPDRPRNLILCSDGTGNSAGKGRGTNVWKTYEALDRDLNLETQQIAFYGDGVGTSAIRPLAMLGGAFGFGLARNVRALYTWLAIHYRPGDRIFLFGFSRGAFTVRCLAGIITRFGILDGRGIPKGEVEGWASRLWMAYKESQHAPFLAWRQRRLRRAMRFEPQERTKGTCLFHRAEGANGDYPGQAVHFVGVWDTVSAYGLPFDLLTIVLSRSMRFLVWIPVVGRFTMTRFKDRSLHPRIRHARHALALDDERQSFHPMPWDERRPEGERSPSGPSGASSLKQVWFSGMHADVGGGYPKGSLSLVSLDWMLREAQAEGLRLAQNFRSVVSGKDPLGPIHDSRGGPGIFYRYKPRDVEVICRSHGMRVDVHESVIERTVLALEDCPPKSLPPVFQIVPGDVDRRFRLPNPPSIVPLRKHQSRRRWTYLVFLAWVAASVGIGVVLGPRVMGQPAPGWGPLGLAFTYAEAALPSVVANLAGAFRRLPGWVFVLLALGAGVQVWRRRVMTRIERSAANLWRSQVGAPRDPSDPVAEPYERPRSESVARFRTWMEAQWEWGADLFSVTAVTALVLGVGLGHFNRAIMTRDVIPDAPAGNAVVESESFDFATTDAGHGSRIFLAANTVYSIDVEPGTEWRDATLNADPTGLVEAPPAILRWTGFMKRDWRYPWFALLGSTGGINQRAFLVGDSTTIGPFPEDRRLYLFVNDATCYLCLWPWLGGAWRFYDNNSGTARIDVTPVRSD